MEGLLQFCALFCLFQLLFVSASLAVTTDYPEVTLSTGKVRGQKLVSAANRVYYSFQGIPYAEPPIGNLRFKAPRALKSWNGTLEAFHVPPACSQPARVVQFPESYSEDCLYLNVFTPHLKPPQDVPMPVMVWIHGGKHYQGSGTPYKYGADFLITEDVIVVTFNYRLGVFGHLNTNSRSAQGNAAFKDKVAVLRWVQREIKQFGGDSDTVTIFGGSSGGQDVNCLYISPMAKGLFHRAISQSSAHCGYTYHISKTEDLYLEKINPGFRLAKILNCSSTEPEEVVACLRNITAQELAERQQDVFISGPGGSSNSFQLSVEEDYGEEIFMSKPPEVALKTSQSTVPYILGFNNAEGKMDVANPVNETQFSEFEKNIEAYIPSNVRENFSKTAIEKIASRIKQFYFGDKPVTFENVKGYIDFMTDRKFGYFTVESAKTLSTRAPVYLYYFAFDGNFTTPHNSIGSVVPGVTHGDELGYLFYRNLIIHEQNNMSLYPRECTILSQMVRLWANFAKHGNPTPDENDGVLAATWLPVNNSFTQHLVINDTLEMVTEELLPARIALWETVYNMRGSQEDDITVGLNIMKAIFLLALVSLLYLLYESSCTRGFRPKRYETL